MSWQKVKVLTALGKMHQRLNGSEFCWAALSPNESQGNGLGSPELAAPKGQLAYPIFPDLPTGKPQRRPVP